MRILIIAHDFPPLNTPAARRPYSWARTWAALGHDVEVVTTQKQWFDGWPGFDPNRDGFRVREVAYLPRRSAVVRSAATAAGTARTVEFLRRLTAPFRSALGLLAQPTTLAYWPMLRASLNAHRELPFDTVISTSGPEVCTMVAHSFTARTGVPWVADYRDLWAPEFVPGRPTFIAWLTGKLNRRMLQRAMAVSTVSKGLANYFHEIVQCPIWVCYNGYMVEAPARPLTRAEGPTRLVYTGRLYPQKRDLRLLLSALQELRRERPDLGTRLRVEIYGASSGLVRRQIREYGLEDVVSDHGFVSYEESIAAQAGADALLFLDWSDPRAKGVLTGKLFEYLASRRPILSVGAIADTEAAALIRAAGAGVVCTDRSSIRDALEALAEGRFRCNPHAAVAQYSRQEQARRLLAKIEELVATRSQRSFERGVGA